MPRSRAQFIGPRLPNWIVSSHLLRARTRFGAVSSSWQLTPTIATKDRHENNGRA
jgi:hypothetical protein